MNDIDVLCVGVTSYDLVFTVDHHPTADEKSIAKALISCGGGPAANAAVTVAKMGLNAAFCGYLGNDVFGNLHYSELQSSNVNTKLVVRGEEATPVSTILVKPNGERSLVNYRASKPLASNALDIPVINPKVILFDGHEPHISLLFLSLAKQKNIPTILDAGSVNKGSSLLYDKVDYLVCSEIFAKEITGIEKPEDALTALSAENKNVIITLGEKGLLWKTKNAMAPISAFKIDALDTTGAGDVFHGAFARCIALNKEWQHTLFFSSAAAALSCTKLGARTSIPTIKEVDAFLKQQGL